MLVVFYEKISANNFVFQKKYLHLHSPTGGALAQLVEQRTENPCVPGSIPGGTTSQKPCKNARLFYLHTY